MKSHHRAPAALVIGVLVVTLLGAAPTPLSVPAAAADGQSPERCEGSAALVNSGFEEPEVHENSYRLFQEKDVPGWDTTATDNQIEIWGNNFGSVPAYSGTQFAELNATQASALFQVLPTVPGQRLNWSLAHRGRRGEDTMAIEFGPPGGPYVLARSITDGKTAWGEYSGQYLVPEGQTSTELRFRAVSSAGGSVGIGNFLDAVTFGTDACLVTSKSVTNNTRTDPQAQGNDELTYTITTTNSGGSPSSNTVLTDAIPDGTTYVPGSLRVITSPTNADNGAKTDAVDADTGSVTAGQVKVNLGDGATGATSGALLPGDSTSISFKVRVVPGGDGGSVVNQAKVTFSGGVGTSTSNRVTTLLAGLADLQVSKTSNPASQAAGANVTYNVTVSNNGPDTSRGIKLVDTLPAGTTYVSSEPPDPATCSVSGQTVTCSTASLADGASLTVPITVRIDQNRTESVLNTVRVSSSTTDENSANNVATATTAVTTRADMSIVKSVDPTTVSAGNQVTYTLTASNAGPSLARDVMVSDLLPVGMSVISTASTAGTCSSTGSSVSCELGNVNPGASPAVTVVARVAPGTDATTLSNTARVTSTTSDANSVNNESTAAVRVTRQADLSVTKSGPAQATAGGPVTFEVVVRNDGPSNAREVRVADPVPAGLTAVSAVSSQGTCANGACSIGTIATGASVTITLEYAVDPGRTSAVTNTATASSGTPDPDTGDLSASHKVAIITSADLSLSKSQSPETVMFGTPVTYTLTVTNNGPSVATGISITDPLPAGLTFASSDDGCTAVESTVRCPVDDVGVNESASVSFVADTPSDGSGEVSNSAIVSAQSTDPVAANNSATATANGEASADMSLTKTTSPNSPMAGGPITYTLTATNNGPSSASGITVVDTLPEGITATTASAACEIDGNEVTCTAATLDSGESAEFTINGTVAPGARGSSVNSATVSSDVPSDPTPGNNTTTSTSQLSAAADVAVTLTPNTQVVVAGTDAEFSLTISNNGPSTAVNTVVTGMVPDGLTPVAGSSGGACTVTGSTVTCIAGTLEPGQSLPPVPLVATVDPAASPGSTIDVSAQAHSTTPETNETNNVDSASVAVSAKTDLAITKTVDPDPVISGATAKYTVSVTNGGPSTATEIVVEDVLPASFTAEAVSAGGQPCTIGATVSCEIAALAPDTTADITIEGTFNSDLAGEVTNTASVRSGTPDSNPANNTTSLTSTVALRADIRVSKSGPAEVTAGHRVEYSIAVTNTGPSDAENVALRDELPEGAVASGVTVEGPEGACSAADAVVTCDFGAMVAGDSVYVTISAPTAVDLPQETVLENQARVTSDTPGPSANRTSEVVETTVNSVADLFVTKVAAHEPVAGAEMRYTLMIRNDGPSIAREVVVTDKTPEFATLIDVRSTGQCAAASGNMKCAVPTMEPGAALTVNVWYRLDTDSFGQKLANTVTAQSQTTDPNPANSSATVTNTIGERSQLTIDKAGPANPVRAGETARFIITVTNTGPSDARTVSVSDDLPEQLTATAIEASDGGTCDLATLTCEVGPLPDQDSRTITVDTLVEPGALDGATLTNTATASSGSAGVDTSDTANVSIVTAADLVVTKELVTADPTVGESLLWRMLVVNRGPSVATGVTLTDPAPRGVELTSVTTSQGECVVETDLFCALGELTIGDSVEILLTGALDSGQIGEVTNSVTVTAGPVDPDESNNTAVVTSEVATRADLSMTKTATKATATPGNAIEWNLTVRNDGPSTATDVLVSDDVPAVVVGVRATFDGQQCEVSDGGVRCVVGSLPSGADVSITVSGLVAADATQDSVLNSAEVVSGTPDPDMADNSATAVVEIMAVADRTFRKEIVETGLEVRTAMVALVLLTLGIGVVTGRHPSERSR